ncbi:MAG: hypothetical protein NTX50_19195 [Candidatus Sumerlaeota bacterium]|nr:hypothetical protein [Candidatus Sumerlaeota bacterium]
MLFGASFCLRDKQIMRLPQATPLWFPERESVISFSDSNDSPGNERVKHMLGMLAHKSIHEPASPSYLHRHRRMVARYLLDKITQRELALYRKTSDSLDQSE